MTSTMPPLSRERLAEILDSMEGLRVAVIGDLMLDRYLLGTVDRISPEAPVPVVVVDEERDEPGGAANVAANIAALGATAEIVGAVGDDAAGDRLREVLGYHEVESGGLVQVPGRTTTTKTRILAQSQQVVRIDREVDNGLADRYRDAVVEAAHRALEAADVVLFADYDKGVLDEGLIGDLLATARESGIPSVADPKRRNFFAFAGVTVFKPNRRELDDALRTNTTGEDIDLLDARRRLAVEHLLLTLGADGMALVTPDEVILRTPSRALGVFDVSGAGDTVTAWLGAALAADATVAEAAWLANLAAGIEVGKQGTATVSTREVRDAWEALHGD
jgi:D-beta-D-heptose 7-phosphate kinase/D-beta-D-heptose 1-phosphate adenosyltransferase